MGIEQQIQDLKIKEEETEKEKQKVKKKKEMSLDKIEQQTEELKIKEKETEKEKKKVKKKKEASCYKTEKDTEDLFDYNLVQRTIVTTGSFNYFAPLKNNEVDLPVTIDVDCSKVDNITMTALKKKDGK